MYEFLLRKRRKKKSIGLWCLFVVERRIRERLVLKKQKKKTGPRKY